MQKSAVVLGVDTEAATAGEVSARLLDRRLRGARLIAGISLSNEMDEQLSQLRIIDPDVEEPLIELSEKEGGRSRSAPARLCRPRRQPSGAHRREIRGSRPAAARFVRDADCTLEGNGFEP